MKLTNEYIKTLDINDVALDQTIREVTNFVEEIQPPSIAFTPRDISKFLSSLAQREGADIQEESTRSGHLHFSSRIVPDFHTSPVNHGHKNEPCRGRERIMYIEELKDYLANLMKIRDVRQREIDNPYDRGSYFFSRSARAAREHIHLESDEVINPSVHAQKVSCRR